MFCYLHIKQYKNQKNTHQNEKVLYIFCSSIMHLKSTMNSSFNLKSNSVLTYSICLVTDLYVFIDALILPLKQYLFTCAKTGGSSQGYIVLYG